MRRVLYHRTTAENAETACVTSSAHGNREHHRGVHGFSPGLRLSNTAFLDVPRYIATERRTMDEYGTALLEVATDAAGAFMEAHEWKVSRSIGNGSSRQTS